MPIPWKTSSIQLPQLKTSINSVPVLQLNSNLAKHLSDRPLTSIDRFKINLFHIPLVQKQLKNFDVSRL